MFWGFYYGGKSLEFLQGLPSAPTASKCFNSSNLKFEDFDRLLCTRRKGSSLVSLVTLLARLSNIDRFLSAMEVLQARLLIMMIKL